MTIPDIPMMKTGVVRGVVPEWGIVVAAAEEE
jgi:hypothetical protein